MSDDDEKVVSLQAFKDGQSEHKSGEALCTACKHEWVAVQRVDDSSWLICPECDLQAGHFKGVVIREGAHWHCNCGNDLFYMTRNGPYCPQCGAWAIGWVDG